jgi:hypothetical protein
MMFVPPAINTFPFGKSVALWRVRATVMFPVGVSVPRDCASTATAPHASSAHPLHKPMGSVSPHALTRSREEGYERSRTQTQRIEIKSV